jgi:ABC-type Na+ transport system ATPase subunit NatA
MLCSEGAGDLTVIIIIVSLLIIAVGTVVCWKIGSKSNPNVKKEKVEQDIVVPAALEAVQQPAPV